LVEIKDLLMVPGLYRFHGMMEYWNTGVLGISAEINYFNCKKKNFFQPIIPLFHYSIIPIVSEANLLV